MSRVRLLILVLAIACGSVGGVLLADRSWTAGTLLVAAALTGASIARHIRLTHAGPPHGRA
jgi:hypothetical protein